MLLAHCHHCSIVFRSAYQDIFGFQSGRDIVFRGNIELCPNCGKAAHTADGVFDVVNSAFKLTSGPNLTQELYRQFAELLREHQKGNISDQSLENAAGEIHPKLGEAVRLARHGPKAMIFALLLALITQCEFKLDANVDINKLFDQIFSSTAIEPPLDDKPEKP